MVFLEITLALLGIATVFFRNKWALLLLSFGGLYYFMTIPTVPTSLKVGLVFIMFLWILNQGKGK